MPICWKRETIQNTCTNKPVQYQYADRVDSWDENEAFRIRPYQSFPCFKESRDDRSQIARPNKGEPTYQRLVLREKLAICCTITGEALNRIISSR
jgi:hypothetical protein